MQPVAGRNVHDMTHYTLASRTSKCAIESRYQNAHKSTQVLMRGRLNLNCRTPTRRPYGLDGCRAEACTETRMRPECLTDPIDLTPLRPPKKKEISHAPREDVRGPKILILRTYVSIGRHGSVSVSSKKKNVVDAFVMFIPRETIVARVDYEDAKKKINRYRNFIWQRSDERFSELSKIGRESKFLK